MNGFGRIGRGFLRVCLRYKEFINVINIIEINDLTDLKNIVHLLKFDSTFGRFYWEDNIHSRIKIGTNNFIS
jgi:glyceraldehyde 3-phosphate dehydrogenase